MNTEELIKYIKHYIKDDKTKSAIMLTGDWGSGKSYFVQNELIPELNGNCVVVSLYGLANLFEVSRSLYFEYRFGTFNKKTEKVSAGKLIAKTITKGVASYFGVDLSISKEDLGKLYNSLDTKDRLIIFEDIERSNINILEFLGYVNNLVEQNNGKVLLIANENEFIKYKKDETERKSQLDETIKKFCEDNCDENKVFTDETIEYIRLKEKTISDTINFKCNFDLALVSIIKSFNNDMLNNFTNAENISRIKNICDFRDNFNLRAIIFACQKTVDIFQEIENLTIDFAQIIFLGIISYSLLIKKEGIVKWTDNSMLSTYLGSVEYPLFHFCYHYIVNHTLLTHELETAQEDFNKYKLNAKTITYADPDLNMLYSYYIHTEKDIRTAVLQIEQKLSSNQIPYAEYGKLASYIVGLSSYLEIDISKIKEYLINNLVGQNKELEIHLMFSSGLEILDKVKQKEFLELQKKMIASLNIKLIQAFDFEKTDIDTFCKEVYNLNDKFTSEGKFVGLMDIENFIDKFKQCNSLQIYNIRRVFNNIYAPVNISDFLPHDKIPLEKLKLAIENLLDYEAFDSIQKLQSKWFLSDLKRIIEKFN